MVAVYLLWESDGDGLSVVGKRLVVVYLWWGSSILGVSIDRSERRSRLLSPFSLLSSVELSRKSCG
jgi:hypothetical protein